MIGRVSAYAAAMHALTRILVVEPPVVWQGREPGREKGPKPCRTKWSGEQLREIRRSGQARECARRLRRGW